MADRRVRSAVRMAMGGAALLGAIVTGSTRAGAQERLHFEELPDAALHLTTLAPSGEHPDVRLLFEGGVGASRAPDDDRAPTLVRPFLGVGLGVWGEPWRQLQLASEITRPFASGTEPSTDRQTLRWSDFEGAHRVRAIYGFGTFEKGDSGVDLEANGTFFHAAPTTTSFLRRDLPAGAFWDGTASFTLRPRYTSGSSKDSFATPLTYSVRRVRTGIDGASGGFTSHAWSAGVGLQGYDEESTKEWFEIVGLTWEKTTFDPPALEEGIPIARMPGIDRIDLRAAHFDFGMAAERDMSFIMSGYLGGSWLWDPATKHAIGAFTGGLSMRDLFRLDDDGKDLLDFGLGFARRAGFLSDGTTLTRGWRLEGVTAATLGERRMGGSIRGALEQLEVLPLGATDTADAGWRAAIASEIFYAPLEGFELGVTHVATDRCPPVTSPTSGEWCQELSVFLRVHEVFAPRREEPPPKEPAATPPPADAPRATPEPPREDWDDAPVVRPRAPIVPDP